MRRGLATLFVLAVTFAAIGPLPFGNNCCCKAGCPMKRATQMHCSSKTCGLTQSVVTMTIAEAILAPPMPEIAPRAREIAFAQAAETHISQDRVPDTPPPRA